MVLHVLVVTHHYQHVKEKKCRNTNIYAEINQSFGGRRYLYILENKNKIEGEKKSMEEV
jgi:hypothetical protein